MEVVKLTKPKTLSWLMTVAAAGLLIGAAVQSSDLVWKIIVPEASSAQHDLHHRLQERQDTPIATDLALLNSVFVLNKGGVATLRESDISSAIETRLELTLRGILMNDQAELSRAIIGAGNQQQVYRPGQLLEGTPGTVTVEAIHAQYVVINNNSRQEILRMDDVNTGVVAVVQQQAPVVNKTSLLSGRSLTDLLRLQPMFSTPGDTSSLVGMQIRHGSRQDFLSAVGLRQGDVITAVNGQQVNDIANVSNITSQLASVESVVLSLLRDGAPVDVSIQRDQL